MPQPALENRPGTSREGLLRWLLARARAGGPGGCRLRNSEIHHQAQADLAAAGYRPKNGGAYSSSNLERRWREIREWGQLEHHGYEALPVPSDGNEQTWKIVPRSTPPTPTSPPSQTPTGTPPSPARSARPSARLSPSPNHATSPAPPKGPAPKAPPARPTGHDPFAL